MTSSFPYVTFAPMPPNISQHFSCSFLLLATKEEFSYENLLGSHQVCTLQIYFGPWEPTSHASSISLFDFSCSYSQILLQASHIPPTLQLTADVSLFLRHFNPRLAENLWRESLFCSPSCRFLFLWAFTGAPPHQRRLILVRK